VDIEAIKPKVLAETIIKLPPQAWFKMKCPVAGVVKTVAFELVATVVLALRIRPEIGTLWALATLLDRPRLMIIPARIVRRTCLFVIVFTAQILPENDFESSVDRPPPLRPSRIARRERSIVNQSSSVWPSTSIRNTPSYEASRLWRTDFICFYLSIKFSNYL
jgi:hypothetical protein